jgi:hypothetical protein
MSPSKINEESEQNNSPPKKSEDLIGLAMQIYEKGAPTSSAIE